MDNHRIQERHSRHEPPEEVLQHLDDCPATYNKKRSHMNRNIKGMKNYIDFKIGLLKTTKE